MTLLERPNRAARSSRVARHWPFAQDGELRLCLGGKCRELVDHVPERSGLRWPRQIERRLPSAFGSRRGLRGRSIPFGIGFQSVRLSLLDLSDLETGSLLPRAQRSDFIVINLCTGTSALRGTGLVQRSQGNALRTGRLPVRRWEEGDQQLADLSRAPKLLLVDVRRQLVEARQRALDQVIVSSLVGGSYGD